jgi:DNA-damage-inducible protein J
MATKEKISQVNFKIPEKEKKEVTAIFNYYGLDLSTGIKMYLKAVQHTKSIPLKLTPVTELDAAINEADRGEFAGSYDSIADFDKAMNDED